MKKTGLLLLIATLLAAGCSTNRKLINTYSQLGIAGTKESSIYRLSSSVNTFFIDENNKIPDTDGTHGYFNVFLAYSQELDQFVSIRMPNPDLVFAAKEYHSYENFCIYAGKGTKTWQGEIIEINYVYNKNFLGQENNYFTIDFVIKSNTQEKFITEKLNLFVYDNKAFLTYINSIRFDNKRKKLHVFSDSLGEYKQ
jgi:hypothetical protein